MKKLYFIILTIFSFSFSFSQTIVSTNVENKNAIVEESTGIHCSYCPEGHAILDQAINQYPGDVFVIKYHEGGYAWDCDPNGGHNFAIPYAEQLGSQAIATGQPAASVNRQYFSNYTMGGGTAMSRGAWSLAISEVLEQSAYVNVGVEAIIVGNELTVHVEAYYTGNSPEVTNFLHIALLQDGVIGPQGGSEANPSYVVSSSPNPNYLHNEYDYLHMDRLVDLINGFGGDPISTTSTGSFIDRTYTYSIPDYYNDVAVDLNEMEVVAYITETSQDIINGDKTSANLQLLTNDIGVTSINSPTNSSNSAEEYVTVTVTNFGENSISDFDVSYQLNSENIVTETFTNTLNSNESSDFTFNTTLNLSNLNSCQLSVYTSLNEDENISNDAITQSYSFIDYCTPSAGSCNLDGIKQFILNTINVDDGGTGCNTEPSDGPLGYADRRNLITDLSRYSGQNNYTIQAMQLWGTGSDAYPPNSEGFAVWIDFDDSGTFEASELLIESSFDGYGVLEDFALNVPTDAPLGIHILRAKAIDLTTGDNLTNPCDDFSYGEVHDYSVNIVASLGTNNIELSKNFNVYPNPSNGIFNIKSEFNNTNYKIYDILGKEVANGILSIGNNSINISRYNDGIYILNIDLNNGTKTNLKLIKN
jgi:hypothetical protein